MAPYPILIVKPEKEIHLKNRHHAIFQNAVEKFPVAQDGAIVEVRSSIGEFLCYAHLNRKAYICGRAIAFEQSDPLEQLRKKIEGAVKLRREIFQGEDTDAYRLINAEGDGVPGLIVDRYGDVVVCQLTTMGMEKLRPWIGKVLTELCAPKGIFEKSTGPGRKKEGLESAEGWISGKADTVFTVQERGIQYRIGLVGSQKTGLFLDQREMRSLVRKWAKGKTVLDCCAYVGGFSLSALKGGALAADAVDYDGAALDRAREHAALNGFSPEQFQTHAQDVFDFLRCRPQPHPYDFVILDPPAFAKRSTDLEPAKKAYTDLNRLGMEALTKGGLLLTCSCSFQVDPVLFQTIVFHAARQARRSVRILSRHLLAADHPINLFHPEVDYLKSLLLWVE